MFQNRVIYLIFITHKVSCGAEPREEKIRTYSSIHEYFWILRFLMYSDLEYSGSWCIQRNLTYSRHSLPVAAVDTVDTVDMHLTVDARGACRKYLSSCRTVEPTVAVLSYTVVYCRTRTVILSILSRTVAILSITVELYCRTVEPMRTDSTAVPATCMCAVATVGPWALSIYSTIKP